ncbi:hypothetical protein D0869_08770 [Hortaea werneckii]|uniref:Eukaryotic translation initiation factor 3 subunit M n=2 Tax=Hortaea werneckii TaxID=91943 RepID=A0A3M7BRZ0_HORWE|nr:PCI-domain-containing protein [Hortaea werneckii]KAI7027151.1 PCI-domain-containing protein [Hortaea werneckii]KAI7673843.1 PCI-domain-containing protein [Hortaea werneckii]RMX78827.1 hypothetical protein D0869_08770 [Hortaea werneckii]RMY01790.1 hypothetical protein D0868_08308 [Hortaea werneckii]
MPGVPNLSLVEGSFEELALELASYLDGLKGEGSTVAAEITPSLADAEKPSQQTDKDAVLKKLVIASAALNGAPERELQAAYNLLIHLISQVEEPERYLPPVCKNLSSPITSSPQNGTGIALGVLGTLFNAIQPDEDTRYHVLLPIIELVKTSGRSGTYDTLAPQLTNLDAWLEEWEMEPDECRKLYLAVSQAAGVANRTEDSYIYLLKALRTLQDQAASPEARDLSLRALKTALQAEKHFDFQDLTALDSIQALRKSDEAWGELLEIFSGQLYEDLQEFKEANPSFLSSNSLNEDTLDRKMRLLTLTSLAAQSSSDTRTLPYSRIAKALNIPSEDVEMWVIDCIRCGLVEGKLSQQKGEFLIHRCTHRAFGEKQWREVASRLETWRTSLVNVLNVIRSQKEDFIREKEAELAGPEVRSGQNYRPDRRQRNAPVEVE